MSQITQLGAANGGGGTNSYQTDNGIAVPAAGVITFNAVSQAGSSVTFSGSGSTVRLNVTDSNSNTIIGLNAGNNTLTALNATAVGKNSLHALTSSLDNTAYGMGTLQSLTSGLGGNTAIGKDAMKITVTNTGNTAVGFQSLFNCISDNNTAIGYSALQNLNNGSVTSSVKNVGLGFTPLFNLASGSQNIAIGGNQPLFNLLSGSNNIAILQAQAGNYTGSESSNILIGNAGTVAENNAIHIGTQGAGSAQQNTCYIAGIASVAVANTNMVTINTATGQLGSQAVPSSSISITGDSGGALTGSSFTFTGGSTGLTFAGAGTTETLGGTLVIANGGTNATSMSTSTGIVKYDGTSLVTSATAKIDSSNRYTNSSQPAFSAYNSSDQTSVTGDGTVYTVLYNTSLFDQDSNFSSPTFAAPLTGRYRLTGTIALYNIGAQTYMIVRVVTTGRTVIVWRSNLAAAAFANFGVSFGTFLSMSATDTATVTLEIGGSTKTINIDSANTLFSGELVC